MKKRLFLWAAGGMAVLGTSLLLMPFLFLGYTGHMSHTLLAEADSRLISSKKPMQPLPLKAEFIQPPHHHASGLYPEPAPEVNRRPHQGEIIGKLSIPSLKITEAILEGTGPKELAKAPGHLPFSVLPGQIGTSIIAGHNATTFRQLDQLTEGMEITVTTDQGVFTFSVTGKRVLHVNDPFPNRTYPSVALETCFPLDALYLTDQRLFVEAALVKSELSRN